MKAHIDFWGQSVDVMIDDVASKFGNDATDEEIREAVLEDIEEALREDVPTWYSNDLDAVCERVRGEIKAQNEEGA